MLCEYEDEYKVGDIVVYSIGGNYIAHRIVDIEEDNFFDMKVMKIYTLKGDNNNYLDKLKVYDENIICRLIV